MSKQEYLGRLNQQIIRQNQLSWTSSDTTVAVVNNSGIITALKPGQIIINIQSITHSSASTACNVTVTPGKFTDVGVGADGSVFVVGSHAISGGGYPVYKVVNNELHKLPDCGALRLAVSPQGVPWVINSLNNILKYSAGAWVQMAGSGSDIGIGADGSVFAISTVIYSQTGGFTILKWNGSNWDTMTDCSGIHIAVGPNGIPWIINKTNKVYRFSGSITWDLIDGVYANDIGIGANGTVAVSGQDPGTSGYNPAIYQYNSGTLWTQLSDDFGVSVSVDPTGKIWWIDKSGFLHNQ